MTREESYRCVQRRDSMICIAFFCIIVLGVVLAMPFVAQGQTSHAERTSQFVCVQSGDTLWSIALSCRGKLSKFRPSEVMRSRAMGYA